MSLSILVTIGALIMIPSLIIIRKLMNKKYLNKYNTAWKILNYLLVIFLIGYIILIYFSFHGDIDIIHSLTGIIFLLGSLFVYITIRTGYRTIQQLHYTTVSKDYVDKIIDSMADTLIVLKVDPDLKITKVNSAILNLLDYTKEEIIGQPLNSILKSNEKVEYFIQECKTDAWLENEEATYYTNDGIKIPVLFSVSCICDNSDVMKDMIIAGKDITELKAAREALLASEKRLKKLNKELLDSNIMKELLLDVITHDLKNPASVIKGFTEIALENNPDDEMLKEINIGTEGLFQIIDSANIMSKIAMGDEIKMLETNISEMIDHIVHEFTPIAKSAGMTIENTVPKGIVLSVNPIFSEVFRNYISNAVKYANSGKKLVVNAEVNKKEIAFQVIDFGETIPKKNRNLIFKRAKQLNNTAGEGLGLAIVDRIAKAHNAEVGVNPNPDGGNIFYFEIPK
jgi:PAS domain S-box-containing protein